MKLTAREATSGSIWLTVLKANGKEVKVREQKVKEVELTSVLALLNV